MKGIGITPREVPSNFSAAVVAVRYRTTGAVPANQPISDGEATDRCKSLRRKMADCPSK